MATQPKTCADCGGSLGRRNTSGRCHRCAARLVGRSPATRAKISASRRLQYLNDPEYRARELARLRQVRSMRTNVGGNLVEGAMWVLGNAVRPAGSPSRMQAGAKTRARRAINAGCPPHLVEQYYFLTTKKRLKQVDAIAAVKAQEEADLQRWRRSVGIVPEPEPEPLPEAAPVDDRFLDRASVIGARAAGVFELWTSTRLPAIVRARWAVFMALHRAGWSQSRIGRETGVDRTTVRYGLERGAKLVECDGAFSALVRRVCAA